MMGSAATSMSTIFNKRVDISPPSIDVLDLIEKLSELHKSGALTKDEFNTKKVELLSKI